MIARREPIEPGEPPCLVDRLRVLLRTLSPIYAFSGGVEYPRSGLNDLEVIVQLLSLTEFADWLRVHGDPTQSRFAEEIHQAADDSDELERLRGDIEKVVVVEPGQPYGDAVEEAAALSRRMRAVLVDTGALADDDQETDPVALLRALLA